MYKNFDCLAQMLRLSPYQYETIKSNYNKYNMSGMVKRGGVLYVPYADRPGIWNWCLRLLYGRPADLIGQNKMLLRSVRRIKLCSNGYHCVRIGKYTYYADNTGHAVSRKIYFYNGGR